MAKKRAAMTREWLHFQFEVDERVGTLAFNRPERLNALTFDVYHDLHELLIALSDQDEVRALVITGRGRGFCSGGDVEAIIGELQRMDVRQLLEFTRMTGRVTQAMRECPLPIIAAVNGVAAGAGAVIALAADLRLLARSASFSFLFSQVGLSGGDMGAAYLLPRVIGLGRAAEALMLGERIDSERALGIGLANRLVEDGALLEEASTLARRLADGPALAHASTKMLLSRELDTSFEASLELDSFTQALLMKSADHGEAYAAINAKRTPGWQGR